MLGFVRAASLHQSDKNIFISSKYKHLHMKKKNPTHTVKMLSKRIFLMCNIKMLTIKNR